MADNGNPTEQSMEETLKTLERQLAGGDEPEDQSAPSAEILKLPDTAADNRKGRAQNRAKLPGAQQVATQAEAPGSGRDVSALEPNVFLDPLKGGSDTLEELVRELVKPMLRRHLDEKLGDIINRLVQAELNKALEEVKAP
jgi:uncharacterized protein